MCIGLTCVLEDLEVIDATGPGVAGLTRSPGGANDKLSVRLSGRMRGDR
jgi:hypothetical protein